MLKKPAFPFLLCLCFILSESLLGQQQARWFFSMKGQSEKKINDFADTALGSFSLRKVDATYNGPLIRVRRGSDNAKIDIGALEDGSLDTVTLKNFVLNSTGFVEIWYNQSGAHNKHAQQFTATRQPIIVINGTIERIDGYPALRFFKRNPSFLIDSIPAANSYSIYTVQAFNTNENLYSTLLASGNSFDVNSFRLGLHANGTNIQYYKSGITNLAGGTVLPGVLSQISFSIGSVVSVSQNGITLFNTNEAYVQPQALSIGSVDPNTWSSFDGWITEILIFGKHLLPAVFSSIENNQYEYYGIGRNVPGQPLQLNVEAGNARGQLNLQWQKPESDGAAPIIDYKIEFRRVGAVNWSEFSDGISSSTSATISGLLDNTIYQFRVSAVNRRGTGLVSEVVQRQSPLPITFNITGPLFGLINKQTSEFTIQPSVPITGTVTVVARSGSLSVPVELNFANSSAPQTFTIVPSSSGLLEIGLNCTNGILIEQKHTITIGTTTLRNNILDLQIGRNSVAAYSVRLTEESYDGPLVRVKDSIHGSMLEVMPDSSGYIGKRSFVKVVSPGTSNLIIGQVLFFEQVWTNNTWRVETWYDQNKNNNFNASQSNFTSSPILVRAGNIVLVNGAPSLLFTGAEFMETIAGSIPENDNTFSIAAVIKVASSSIMRMFDQGSAINQVGKRASILSLSGSLYFSGQSRDALYGAFGSNLVSSLVTVSLPGSVGYVNGGGSSRTQPAADLQVPNIKNTIGRKADNSEFFNGNFSELLVYDTSLVPATATMLYNNQRSVFKIVTALPNTPTGLTGSFSVNNGEVSLSWLLDETSNGTTGHVIQYSLFNQNNWQTLSLNPTETNVTITGLPKNDSLDFRVAGVNGIGVGAFSNTISIFRTNGFSYTGPSYGLVNQVSGLFSLSPRQPYTGTVTITPEGGGLTTPLVLQFNNSSTPLSFTITPTLPGTVRLRISTSNSDNFFLPTILYTASRQEISNNFLEQKVGTAISAGYSVRILRSGYTGPLLCLQHEGNGAKIDVTADTSGVISHLSIATVKNKGNSNLIVGNSYFLGELLPESNWRVAIWYSQNGNSAFHAVQNSVTNQPYFSENGLINYINARPSIVFKATNQQWLETTQGSIVAGAGNFTINVVGKISGLIGTSRFFDQGGGTLVSNVRAGYLVFNRKLYFSGENNDFNFSTLNMPLNTLTTGMISVSKPGSVGYLNNLSETSVTVPSNTLIVENVGNNIGRKNGGVEYVDGSISELLIYNTAIRNNTATTLLNDQIAYYYLNTTPPVISFNSTPPGQPINPIAIPGVKSGEINLRWQSPTSSNPIRRYNVEFSLAGANNFQTYTPASSDTFITVKGLLIDTEYDFRISATDVFSQTGIYSPIVRCRTPKSIVLSGPSYGLLNQPSTFVVTPSGNITGTIIILPSGGGVMNPVKLTFTSSNAPQSFQIIPTVTGTISFNYIIEEGSTFAVPANPVLFTASNYGLNNTALNEQIGITSASMYSVRPIKASYTGPLMLLRNSVGDKVAITADSAGFISRRSVVTVTVKGATGSTLTVGDQHFFGDLWTGNGSNWTVETWFNQNGNPQLNAFTSTFFIQPILVENGVLHTVNGITGLSFPVLTPRFLSVTNQVLSAGNTTFTINAVVKPNLSSGGGRGIFSHTERNNAVPRINNGAELLWANGNLRFSGGNNDALYPLTMANDLSVSTIVVSIPGSTGYLNHSSATSTMPNTSLSLSANSVTRIGFTPNENTSERFYFGTIFEIIAYNSALSQAHVQKLHTNQGHYYRIPVSLPSAPVNLLVSEGVDAGTVNLIWQEPTNTGGENISNYKIEYRVVGSSTWELVSTQPVNKQFLIEGLIPGTFYEFRIAARNTLGFGDFCLPVSIRSPQL